MHQTTVTVLLFFLKIGWHCNVHLLSLTSEMCKTQ